MKKTTQFCGAYFRNHDIKIPIKHPVFQGKYPAGFEKDHCRLVKSSIGRSLFHTLANSNPQNQKVIGSFPHAPMEDLPTCTINLGQMYT